MGQWLLSTGTLVLLTALVLKPVRCRYFSGTEQRMMFLQFRWQILQAQVQAAESKKNAKTIQTRQIPSESMIVSGAWLACQCVLHRQSRSTNQISSFMKSPLVHSMKPCLKVVHLRHMRTRINYE